MPNLNKLFSICFLNSVLPQVTSVRHNKGVKQRGWPNMPKDIRDGLKVRHPTAAREEFPHDEAWRPPLMDKDWKRRQRAIRKVKLNHVPEQFKRYDEEFAKVVSFESQLESLSLRGFLRPYKAYDPPQDLDQRLNID